MGVHKLRLGNYIYFYYAANNSRVPVSVGACMRCRAYMPMAHAEGDADGYKLSLRLTPTIYVAIVPRI